MPESAKIRNVAVVGHRGTGKTSLVEALLFQTGKINRLGTVEAGTTVSDSDEDEHKRQLSISMSLEHTEWQDRKVNLVDVPGRSGLPGRAPLRGPRRRGRARDGLGRHGRRGRDVARLEARRRARSRTRRLREHARPRARRLLPDARGAAQRALDEVRRRAHPDRLRARAHRHRRRPPHVLVREPRGGEGGRARADPRRDGRPRRRVPREAPRRRRRDRRVAHGALSRGAGPRRPRGRRRAEGGGHERRRLPGGVRCRVEEPGDARAPRPARRGRAVAREEGLADRRRRRVGRSLRLQDGRRPVRGPHQPLPRPQGHRDRGHDAREPALEVEGAHGDPARRAGQGAPPGARSSGRATSDPSPSSRRRRRATCSPTRRSRSRRRTSASRSRS